MKRLIKKLSIFALIFVVLDFVIGAILASVEERATGGNTYRNDFIVNHTDADVILLGSSRCIHHYDPRIITDSLGLSCYNAGYDGNGILMMYPYFKMLTSRYHPRLVIYDVNSFDIAQDDYSRYLKWLRAYHNVPCVDSVINDINPTERYKLACHTYRFNDLVLTLLTDAFHPIHSDILGYRPLEGSLGIVPKQNINHTPLSLAPLKREYLTKLITDCRSMGIKLIFLVSPAYTGYGNPQEFVALADLCQQYDVPFFSFLDTPGISDDRSLFVDTQHLNATGAVQYNNTIIPILRNLLAQ
ncbi:MAG: hypothetical protein ACI31C_06435 [Muribaculaceae bacterium]